MSIISLFDTLVLISGFFVGVIFIPQIRLLLKVKESTSLSAGSLWLTWILQTVVLIQILLHANYQLAFMQSVSLAGVSIELILLYYYRVYPGGRN